LNSIPGFNYQPAYISSGNATVLFENLWRDLAWKHYKIKMFGRKVLQPRLTAWYSDPDVVYQYSGLTLQPTAWHAKLDQLRNSIQSDLEISINSVLANAYRNGADSMGWHADNEPELGCEPVIASISLGAKRRFLIRRGRRGPSQGIDMEHGSLLLMTGRSQQDYQHCLPKTKKNPGLRINLTFRLVKSS